MEGSNISRCSRTRLFTYRGRACRAGSWGKQAGGHGWQAQSTALGGRRGQAAEGHAADAGQLSDVHGFAPEELWVALVLVIIGFSMRCDASERRPKFGSTTPKWLYRRVLGEPATGILTTLRPGMPSEPRYPRRTRALPTTGIARSCPRKPGDGVRRTGVKAGVDA